jgi:proteasome beta subunit
MNQDIVKKGTTTVGIMCKDGIVMAADKRAVLGMSIIGDKKVDKVFKIADNLAVTIAGTVSDAQLITK